MRIKSEVRKLKKKENNNIMKSFKFKFRSLFRLSQVPWDLVNNEAYRKADNMVHLSLWNEIYWKIKNEIG